MQQQPQAPAEQPAPVSAFGEPVPIKGRMTYGRMPAHVAMTPEQQAEVDAWERGETNRRVLERAIAVEKRPRIAALLQQEYNQLFGVGP